MVLGHHYQNIRNQHNSWKYTFSLIMMTWRQVSFLSLIFVLRKCISKSIPIRFIIFKPDRDNLNYEFEKKSNFCWLYHENGHLIAEELLSLLELYVNRKTSFLFLAVHVLNPKAAVPLYRSSLLANKKKNKSWFFWYMYSPVPFHDTLLYPPNIKLPTWMIVTVGPLSSHFLWNVDAAQPSCLACQHLTNLLPTELMITGSKNDAKFSK